MLGPKIECEDLPDGRRLTLVPTTPEHLKSVLGWLADRKVTRFLNAGFPFSPKGEDEWYEQSAKDPGKIIWSICVDGIHVGAAGIHDISPLRRTGTTGILIGDPAYWGKGVATRVMRARAEYAFLERDLVALYTEICLANTASWKAATRAGYRKIGQRPHACYAGGVRYEGWIGCLEREKWEKGRVANASATRYSGSMNIRPYKPEDFDRMVGMLRAFQSYLADTDSDGRLACLPEFGPDEARGYLDDVEKMDGAWMVAEGDNGDLLGFVQGIISRDSTPAFLRSHAAPADDGWIGLLYVSDDARGAGAGGKLITAIEDYFWGKGCTACRLKVLAYNRLARDFYEAKGYGERDLELLKARPEGGANG